jgi:hypothetical protein
MMLSLLAVYIDLMIRNLAKHLTQNFDVLIIHFLKKFVYASNQKVCPKEIALVQFNDQSHVSEHLVLLSFTDFRFIEHIEHLLVEIRLRVGFVP